MLPTCLNNAGMKTRQVVLTTALLLLPAAYAQQSDSPKPEPFKVSSGVAEGRKIHSVIPIYPEEAKKSLIQGEVVMTATISKQGDIIDLKVVSGPPLLSDAATEAVKQWKYRPYLLNGEPIEIETTVIVKYHLQTDSPRTERIRVSSGVAEGLLKHRVEPNYPRVAKENHIQGDVALAVLISTEGNVTNVKTISGDPLLVDASTEAVKQWKYRPFLLNGKPIGIETTVLFKFHM